MSNQGDQRTQALRDVVFAIADLTRALGRPPTFRETASALNLPLSTLTGRVRKLRRMHVLRPRRYRSSHCLILTEGEQYWQSLPIETVKVNSDTEMAV